MTFCARDAVLRETTGEGGLDDEKQMKEKQWKTRGFSCESSALHAGFFDLRWEARVSTSLRCWGVCVWVGGSNRSPRSHRRQECWNKMEAITLTEYEVVLVMKERCVCACVCACVPVFTW